MIYRQVYNVLSFVPGLTRYEISMGHEELAQKLVKSGKLRIDLGVRMNFSRFSLPTLSISKTFSKRELSDPQLMVHTKAFIEHALARLLPNEALEREVVNHLAKLRRDIAKFPDIQTDEEMQIARLLAQSAHPSVLSLLIEEGVEVFVSVGNTIGDAMDVTDWAHFGSNSGMQSSDGSNVSVFVSCGGNPIAPIKDRTAEYGDGWPAMARLVIIAAQELGHYSDLLRDRSGKYVGRHSSNLRVTHPTQLAARARAHDLKYVLMVRTQLLEHRGLNHLITLERSVKFYLTHKSFGFRLISTWIKLLHARMVHKNLRREFPWISGVKARWWATQLDLLLEDMLANLAPQADVYKSSMAEGAEAIACVEALARVPQQVAKWGHAIALALMPKLYQMYYSDVIPACIKSYEQLARQKYSFDTNVPTASWLSSPSAR